MIIVLNYFQYESMNLDYTISIFQLHTCGFDNVLVSIAYNCVMKPLLGLAAGLVRRSTSNTAGTHLFGFLWIN